MTEESTRKWNISVEQWKKEFWQTKKILFPVVVNQLLTLFGWYFVYDCQTDPDSPAYYLLDRRRNFTTGNDVYDGALNGAFCITLLAILSFFMLMVALYNFRRLIQCWLSLSCLLIVFGISSMFIRDTLKALKVDSLFLVFGIALIYGAGGAITFFYDKAPLFLHQVYVVCNCALVSLYYLRLLPAHTAWFLLVAIIAWDAFAVLAPHGPLNLITGCAENYSDSILRFLMFTAKIPSEKNEAVEDDVKTCPTNSVEDCSVNEDVSEASEVTEIAVDETLLERTAKDALNDENSIRLGLGDFVFYSVLVGKAASSGSLAATVAAMFGVILGLLITLTVFSDSDDTMPALPCSVALGMIFHFGTLFVFEPVFQWLVWPWIHLMFDQLFLIFV
uniref:Presenilin n=1 Tax=Panagrolaimus sp. JU765 TaxID=591449 RepID=A0AC34QAC1_9BILA